MVVTKPLPTSFDFAVKSKELNEAIDEGLKYPIDSQQNDGGWRDSRIVIRVMKIDRSSDVDAEATNFVTQTAPSDTEYARCLHLVAAGVP